MGTFCTFENYVVVMEGGGYGEPAVTIGLFDSGHAVYLPHHIALMLAHLVLPLVSFSYFFFDCPSSLLSKMCDNV